MRKIKFRCWDKVKKEMIPTEDLELSWLPNECILVMGDDRVDVNEEDTFNLMQFTGLKSKSGIEIYEGDIIESPEGWRGVVIFEKGDYCIDWTEFQETEYEWVGTSCTTLESKGEIKVIGNLYENPELLKG